MDRRTFLKGLVATAAGILVPASVAAEPERRVWALDRTMVHPVRHEHLVEQPWVGSQYWDTDERAMMVRAATGWQRQFISVEMVDRATGERWTEPLVAQLDGSYGCVVSRSGDVRQVNVLTVPTDPSAVTITLTA